jgi:hypothetical protein
VELGALALQQLAPSEVADGVGDRGPGHVADGAGDDDAGQREVAAVSIEPGEQHRRLGSGDADDTGDHRQQGDAEQPEAVDQVRGKCDQRPGNGGQEEGHSRLA